MLVQLIDKNYLRGRGPARGTYGFNVALENGDQYVPGDGFVNSLGQKIDLSKIIFGLMPLSYAEMMDAYKILRASSFGSNFNALFPGNSTCVNLTANLSGSNLVIKAFGINAGNLVEAGPVIINANTFPMVVIVHVTQN
jgi:hypothetical protein